MRPRNYRWLSSTTFAILQLRIQKKSNPLVTCLSNKFVYRLSFNDFKWFAKLHGLHLSATQLTTVQPVQPVQLLKVWKVPRQNNCRRPLCCTPYIAKGAMQVSTPLLHSNLKCAIQKELLASRKSPKTSSLLHNSCLGRNSRA